MITATTLSYENAAGALYEHPAGYAFFDYNPGLRQLADLQALVTHLAELLRRHQWCLVLIDQRRMLPFIPAEIEWVVNFWLQEAPRHVCQLYAAAVLGQNLFARLAAHSLVQQVWSSAITYQAFEDEASATIWLQQQGE